MAMSMSASCWSWPSIAGLMVLLATPHVLALDMTYCSTQNTGSGFSAAYNMYQSNGACKGTCTGKYAFAIISGAYCWCSNIAPGTTVQTSNCNVVCPGYGSEWCGDQNAGLYAYFLIDGKSASGTAGGSGNTPSATTVSNTLSSSGISSSSQSTSFGGSSTLTTDTPSQVFTSVTTVTGQVRTVLITPSSAATDSALGQGTTVSGGKGGIGTGAIVGIVVGVALGLGLIIGLGVWYWLKKKHERQLDNASTTAGSVQGGANGIPSRQVSQMSSAGLLSKAPRINTIGLSSNGGSASRSADSSQLDRRSLGTDQRLNPYAIYAHEESRHSNVSLQDNQDYSRQLRVANPDP